MVFRVHSTVHSTAPPAACASSPSVSENQERHLGSPPFNSADGFDSLDSVFSDPVEPPTAVEVKRSRSQSFVNELMPEHLSRVEQQIDERIRTACLAVIAFVLVVASMYYLREMLRPFFVAVALRYLLSPMIDLLSCQSRQSRSLFTSRACRFRLPRPIAIVLSLLFAFSLLLFLGGLAVRSVALFTSNSEKYRERLQQLATSFYIWFTSKLPESIAPDASAVDAMKVSVTGGSTRSASHSV